MVSFAQKTSALDKYDSKTLLRMAKAYQYGIGRSVDMKKAVRIYSKLAMRYDNKGMVGLGKLYMKGDGVEQNKKSAFKLFEKAAEQDDTEAMCLLADMYRKGDGVWQDYPTAFALYRRASRREYASGDYGAGYMLYKGLGVDQDYDEAEKYLLQGSERGNSACDMLLGSYYAHGFNGSPDYDKAKQYYTQAAKRGHSWAVDIAKKSLLDSIKARNANIPAIWKNMANALNELRERLAAKTARPVSPDSIDGTWSCILLSYDWSGKMIVKEEAYTMTLAHQDSCLNVTLKKGDSIVSQSCLDKNTSEYRWKKSVLTKADRDKYKRLIVSMSFDKKSPMSLYAKVNTVRTADKEKGKPALAILMRTDTGKEQNQSLAIRSVLPAPLVGNKILLNIFSKKVSTVRVDVYNLFGVKVADCGTHTVKSGLNSLNVDASLTRGKYIIVVSNGDESVSKNVVHL